MAGGLGRGRLPCCHFRSHSPNTRGHEGGSGGREGDRAGIKSTNGPVREDEEDSGRGGSSTEAAETGPGGQARIGGAGFLK